MATTFLNAGELNESHVGNIIGLTVRGAGSQWVLLQGVEELANGSVALTVKMLGHNRHMGIRKGILSKSGRVPFQILADFKAWCDANKLDVF